MPFEGRFGPFACLVLIFIFTFLYNFLSYFHFNKTNNLMQTILFSYLLIAWVTELLGVGIALSKLFGVPTQRSGAVTH